MSTDTVLLADFAAVPPKGRICDLGAGPGTLGLLLCAREPGCTVCGLELQETAAEAGRASIAENGMAARMELRTGDLREIEALFPAGNFDAVVSNPPYYPVGSGAVPADPAAAVARSELCCTLPQLCRAAAWLLRTGGAFSLVHKPERLADLFSALRLHGLEPKRLRFVRTRPEAAPSLLLLEARLGGRPGLNVLPELLLRAEDGSPSPEYLRIYHL